MCLCLEKLIRMASLSRREESSASKLHPANHMSVMHPFESIKKGFLCHFSGMSESTRHITFEQFISTKYDNRNIFDACTHGDFPLVVLLWGMAMANPSLNHYDLYNTSDENENTILHYAAASPSDSVDIFHFLIQQLQIYVQQVGGLQTVQNDILNARNTANETPLM